jgi:hypothetical protein
MTNKQYIKHRNLLIPEAIRYTNSLFNVQDNGMIARKFDWDWTRIYLAKMSELAIAEGLCDPGCV